MCGSLTGVLHLVRHARTAANASRRLQGRLDLPLDEVGRQQAAALARVVPRPDRLVVSPMRRARETAAVFEVAHETDARWLEMDYGVMDGVPLAEVPADMWLRWRSEPTFAPDGGETLLELAARVHAACEELLYSAASQEVVVVTHATPIKVAMAWALGAEPEVSWRSFVDQASVTRIEVRDGRPVLVAFNVVP